MPCMLVTLGVSVKFSFLLNFFAPCRVAREVIRSRARCWPGDEKAVVMQATRREAARLGRVEGTRTLNMSFMLVTLDVSKFSLLLNFTAFCRVAREVIQGGVRCGLRRQGGGRLRCVSGMQGW